MFLWCRAHCSGRGLGSEIELFLLFPSNLLLSISCCRFDCVCVLFSSLGRYRYSTNKKGQRTDLGGDQRRLQLFTYVHGVPGGGNMGGNIPTYFLVQSKGIISRQTTSQEERASN